jgi:hypothetical protein
MIYDYHQMNREMLEFIASSKEKIVNIGKTLKEDQQDAK